VFFVMPDRYPRGAALERPVVLATVYLAGPYAGNGFSYTVLVAQGGKRVAGGMFCVAHVYGKGMTFLVPVKAAFLD
jgi:hypothetical protein